VAKDTLQQAFTRSSTGACSSGIIKMMTMQGLVAKFTEIVLGGFAHTELTAACSWLETQCKEAWFEW
jgi:hypothetical protein